jgi:hypothetical protein
MRWKARRCLLFVIIRRVGSALCEGSMLCEAGAELVPGAVVVVVALAAAVPSSAVAASREAAVRAWRRECGRMVMGRSSGAGIDA